MIALRGARLPGSVQADAAMYVPAGHQDRLQGMVLVDPLGAVPMVVPVFSTES